VLTLHHCDARPQFLFWELSPVRAAAQPKQRRGLVKATQVFRAGLVVHAEFYSVLANLLSVPSSVLWSYLLLL